MVEKSDDRLLPTNKIRTIMKSCGDPNAVLLKESVLVVTKAAELFIAYLSQQTYKKNGNKNDLNYNDLSKFVQNEEKLEFLHQILPKKITVKEFRDILERGSDTSDSDDDDDDEEEEEEEEQEEEEEEADGEEGADGDDVDDDGEADENEE